MESNKFLYSTLNLQPTSQSVVPNKLFTNTSKSVIPNKMYTNNLTPSEMYNNTNLSTTIMTNPTNKSEINKSQTAIVPYIQQNGDEDMIDLNGNGDTTSGKIIPFAGRREKYNADFYNRLLKQFDKTFLSKLVDMHNVMARDKINLNDVDNIVEFLIHYKKELSAGYLFSLLFPERSRGCRVPTKFPIPSLTFHQKSNLTITPNASNNWYLQWTPQSLLSSSYSTAYNGNLLLNNSTALNGSTADVVATNYTSVTVDRLQTAGMIQAYRLVSASMIISYVGSVDAHSGVIGGGVDISYIDSLLPDTASSVFSTIDDKIWNLQVNPYEGLRLVYFPKDYSDLSFIRPDISTQSNGISTCLRFLVYGQNMPSGASVRVDLYRNFEAIPYPGMSDFVTIDFYKTKNTSSLSSSSSGEPAIEAGSKIAESGVTVTKLSDEDKLTDFATSNGNIGFKDPTEGEIVDQTKDESRGFFGSIVDIATGLGKTLIGEAVDSVVGNIPFIGRPLAEGLRSGVNWLGDKIIGGATSSW